MPWASQFYNEKPVKITRLLEAPARYARSTDAQENCKVGVWSIFRPACLAPTTQPSVENMDLTPSPWTSQFSWAASRIGAPRQAVGPRHGRRCRVGKKNEAIQAHENLFLPLKTNGSYSTPYPRQNRHKRPAPLQKLTIQCCILPTFGFGRRYVLTGWSIARRTNAATGDVPADRLARPRDPAYPRVATAQPPCKGQCRLNGGLRRQ
jgi:hypothetical protein